MKILLFLRTYGVVGSNFNVVDCFAFELNGINSNTIDKLSAPKLLLIHYIVLVLLKNIIASIWSSIKTINAYSTIGIELHATLIQNTVIMYLVQANNKTASELTARLASVGDVSRASDGNVDDTDVEKGAQKKKQERELIVESTDTSNYNQYIKLLYNMLKFGKNILLNHNFDQLDTTLIGSEQLQTCIKRHSDKCHNSCNIAITRNISLHSNSDVSLGSNFKYWDVSLLSDYLFKYNTNLNAGYNIGDGGGVEMSINGNKNSGLNKYENGFY